MCALGVNLPVWSGVCFMFIYRYEYCPCKMKADTGISLVAERLKIIDIYVCEYIYTYTSNKICAHIYIYIYV